MEFLLRVAGLSFKTKVRRRKALFFIIKRTQLRLLGTISRAALAIDPLERFSHAVLKCVSVFRRSWWRELWRERTVWPFLKLLPADLNLCN